MRAVRAAARCRRDGRDPGRAAGAPRGPPRPGTCRGRRRSRSGATGTATATACRSTAPRARPAQGLGVPQIANVLLPRDAVGRGRRAGPGPDLGRHHRRPGRARAIRTDRCATRAPGRRPGCPPTAPRRWRIVAEPEEPGPGPVLRRPVAQLGAGSRVRAPSGRAARRSRWSRRRATGPTAAGWLGRRPAVGRRAGTRSTQLPLDNYLKGVVPLEMPARGTRPPSGPRPSPPARTRRTSGRTPQRPAVRHHVVPGVRRVRRRAPRVQRRGRRDPPPRAPARRGRRSPSSRSSSGGWTSAGSMSYLAGARRIPTTAGPATPSRLDDAVHDARVRERLARDRQPAPDHVAAARRQRRVGRPRRRRSGLVGGRGPGHGQRRHAARALGLRSTWVTFEVKPRTS